MHQLHKNSIIKGDLGVVALIGCCKLEVTAMLNESSYIKRA